MQKYSVNQYPVSTILSWVQAKEIAIPEIQRPFVWDTIKVRDLLDSLYHGYPIGYIIAWKNPNVRLRDGSISEGKKVLIDGQQRITALRAAILGEPIIDSEYKERRIYIAFNPTTEKFETQTPAIKKDPLWIPDISLLMHGEGGLFDAVRDYCDKNSQADRRAIEQSIEHLLAIKNNPVGFIELEPDLEIESVTEIFIRINSQGVPLSQSDFAMSKIASYEGGDNFGVNLRKCIDYFCHLAREPQFWRHISENDPGFAHTVYLPKIQWLKDENDDLYDPDYSDVLRVAFTKEFERGKMSELVSLLSGRNFETRKFEQGIVEASFQKLQRGVLDFVNETHFKRFLMIINSCGYISSNLIRSKSVLNFAYVLYLKLRDQGMNDALIEKYVRRWFVMSQLTGRYSGSAETIFDADIKDITRRGIENYLKSVEDAELSDAFWKAGLVEKLDTATSHSPFANLFFAAQVRAADKGFLSSDITVADMITHRGDIHHLFPKEYLKTKYKSRREYNQIANFVYAQTEVNIKIGKKAPKEYFEIILEQCNGGRVRFGGITDEKELYKNLEAHCIPREIVNMTLDDYPHFLAERRRLMAKKIEEYYQGL
jgi:hypothetical protein